jgi:hypothetical protein
MRIIKFEIRIDDENTQRIATAWTTEGLSRDNIIDNLALIGALENTKNLINDRIKTLMEKRLK